MTQFFIEQLLHVLLALYQAIPYQIFIDFYDFPIFIEFLGCIEHSDSGLHADRAKGAGDFFMAQFLFWPKPARAWVAQ